MDRIDMDADAIPDGWDVCPGHNDLVDSDGDGIPCWPWSKRAKGHLGAPAGGSGLRGGGAPGWYGPRREATRLAKLQIKGGQKVRLVNAPKGFSLDAPTTRAASADVVLVFAKNEVELDQRVGPALEAAREDRLSWIAYPKAGQLDTDLNRDILWRLLGDKGVRPVRQVALDDVWSALRFRPAGQR